MVKLPTPDPVLISLPAKDPTIDVNETTTMSGIANQYISPS